MGYKDCEHGFAICDECDVAWLEDKKKLHDIRNTIVEFMKSVEHVDCDPSLWDKLESSISCPYHVEGGECHRWKTFTCPSGWTKEETNKCTLKETP